jgi:hypothetical protein
MKRIMLTFAIGMLVVSAFPQGYHKLIRTNTYWDSFNTTLPEICYTGARRDFFINQDTVINGLTYKVSHTQRIMQVNPGPFCPPFVIDTAIFTGACLREDTVAKRVYIMSPMTNWTDQLLYDFSLNAGDTLKSDYLGGGAVIVIDKVEDLLLNNGETRKNFQIKNSFVSFTEGIGGSFGLYAPLPVTFCECDGGYFCIKDNSVNLLGSQCNYPYVGQDEREDVAVSLCPNPADDELTVILPSSWTGSELMISGLNGERVFSVLLKPGTNKVPVSDFKPGVYLYRVKSGRFLQTGKVAIY